MTDEKKMSPAGGDEVAAAAAAAGATDEERALTFKEEGNMAFKGLIFSPLASWPSRFWARFSFIESIHPEIENFQKSEFQFFFCLLAVALWRIERRKLQVCC